MIVRGGLVQFGQVPYSTFVGTGRQQRVSLECRRDFAVAGEFGLPASGVTVFATFVQFFVADLQIDAALRDVDQDGVTILDQADGTAGGGFW